MRTIRIAMIALAISVWLLADCGTANGFGKGRGGGGGGGGGRGGGGGAARHAGGPKPSAQRPKPSASHGHANTGSFRDSHRPKHVVKHEKPQRSDRIQRTDRVASGAQAPAGETHPWSMQRANEERKFEHRLGVADKLEQKAEANGNEHLKETAQRMRQKAQDHYDKRLAKIDSKLPADGDSDTLPGELPDESQPLPEFPSNPAEPPSAGSTKAAPDIAQKLTGRENALRRQLLNEERKLEHQTDLADRLRAMAEEQGDAALLETAERLEQQALDRFEKRMEAISSFQERHGLALDDQ